MLGKKKRRGVRPIPSPADHKRKGKRGHESILFLESKKERGPVVFTPCAPAGEKKKGKETRVTSCRMQPLRSASEKRRKRRATKKNLFLLKERRS